MAPKGQTNHQISSRLQYNSGNTPAFLRQFQDRIGGRPQRGRGRGDEDEEEPSYDDDNEAGGEGGEWEQPDANRPAIPRRPAIPTRPADDPNGDDSDEDSGEERPTVVVLKEGKHLTVEEATNEKRKAKGLPPLPSKIKETPLDITATVSASSTAIAKPTKAKESLSFSSSKATNSAKKPTGSKRKIIGDETNDNSAGGSKDGDVKKKKKAKKESKGLLSFGDE